MRSVQHARYQGRHVKPALHPTRSTLSAGLTAVLLPLCLASPALANAEPTPAASPTASPTSSDAPATPEPSATTSPEAAATTSPTAGESRSTAPAKQQSVVRVSGPRGTVSPGSHTVGVRLLAGDQPVKDGYVRLERKTPAGWEYAGRLLTRADGAASGKLSFPASTRLRAVYQGAATRTAATSSEIVVTVESFRQRAVRVASQQAGKPYRYGSTGPNSFDCSGLMVYVWKQVGKSLPRTSQQQLNATQRISKSAMRPGDLVFTQRNGRVGHVGVFAGNNKFWVAPKTGDVVKLQTIYTSNFLVGRVN